jgi:hypothetical protein
MKLISHRGNIKEPNPYKENSPSYIDIAISSGYDVEVDLRFIDNKFFLGHDTPDYEVNENWLEKRKNKLWIHCKDLESVTQILKNKNNFMFFCHSSDSYVLTSNGYVWVHNLNLNINEKSIIPLINTEDIINFNNKLPYAICTDYVSFCEYNLKSKGLHQ